MALDPDKYVRVGESMVLKEDPSWRQDIKKANRKKNGHPFAYSDGLFAVLGIIKTLTGASYRNLEGMCRASLGSAPDHSTIHARLTALDVFDGTKPARVRTSGKTIRLAIDSSGMTPYMRGQSIQAKWHIRRGFVKLHIIVDADDGTILSAKLTGDGRGSGDALHLEELLDDALGNVAPGPDGKIELLGDGAYVSRRNISVCRMRNVKPLLRLNVKSTTNGRGHAGWGDEVRDQLGRDASGGDASGGDASGGDASGMVYSNCLALEEKYQNQKEWMKRVGYGKRWAVETVFSSLKRLQGEALWSRKVRYMIQEIRLRVAVHNLTVRMGVHV